MHCGVGLPAASASHSAKGLCITLVVRVPTATPPTQPPQPSTLAQADLPVMEQPPPTPCNVSCTALEWFLQLMCALLSTAALAFAERRSRREFAARTANARRLGRAAAEVQQPQQHEQHQQRRLVTSWMGGQGELALTHPLALLLGVGLSLQLVAVLWLLCEVLAAALT